MSKARRNNKGARALRERRMASFTVWTGRGLPVLVDKKASFPYHAAALSRSGLSGLRRKFSFDELLKVSLY